MPKCKKNLSQILVLIPLLSSMFLSTSNVWAATNQFRGVNWADARDNFQSGVIYISGLSASDTYASASIVADRVISEFISKVGSNSVRLPINEPTVSTYWGTYTGAIDKILEMGNRVLFCYWGAAHGAAPANMTAFWAMWKKVVDKYESNSNCYFEIYNEPDMYNAKDLCNLYNDWLTKNPSVPQDRVVLDGSGMAVNVPEVGKDSRLTGCLLAVHDYTMFNYGAVFTTEAQWKTHLQNSVGNYASRTICTEWGAPMSPGSKNGVDYDYQDYNKAGGSYFVPYVRGMSSQMREWKMGNFYWIGLRNSDWYSITKINGSGANITLTVPNKSGVDQLQYSWADTVSVSVSHSKKNATQTPDFRLDCNNSKLDIEFVAPQSGLTFMRIFNLKGNVIKDREIRTSAYKKYSQTFDLGDISEGFYIVKIEHKGNLIKSSKILLTK